MESINIFSHEVVNIFSAARRQSAVGRGAEWAGQDVLMLRVTLSPARRENLNVKVTLRTPRLSDTCFNKVSLILR